MEGASPVALDPPASESGFFTAPETQMDFVATTAQLCLPAC